VVTDWAAAPETPEAAGPPNRRRRALAVLLAVALAALAAGVLAGRASGGPDDSLVRLVPANALAYAHASTDPGRPADGRLWELAQRFPTLRAQQDRLFRLLGRPLNPARDVRPWLGDEAALAVLEGGARRPPALLALAAVGDRAQAEEFLRARPAARYRGTPVYRLGEDERPFGPLSAAFTGDSLVLGSEAAVRAALNVADGSWATLADAPLYERAAADRPAGATVTAYASGAGARRLLGAAAGLGSAQALTASVTSEDDGVRVSARLLRAPGASPPRDFAPALLGRVPEGVAALASVPGADVLAAAAAQLGAADVLGRLRATLPEAAGVQLDRDVLGPLATEAALTVAADGDTPVVTLAARSADPARTREVLARVQAPLAAALGAGNGQFESRTVAGTPAFTLPVTPELQPSWAVEQDTAIVSTAESGLAQLRSAERGIAQARALRAVTGGEVGRVEALVFLDLRKLLALGERTGLTVGPGFSAVRDDLRQVRSAGVAVRREEDDSTAELFLEIP
jgi:Protein of unknown function (DUF3352)